MSKGMKLMTVLLVVVVIAGGAILLLGKKKDNTPSTTSGGNATTGSNEKVAATITFDGSKFSPELTSVKTGDIVKVTNNSDQELFMASDPHPTHTDEPELNAGEVKSHESVTVSVTKVGTWGYHNHENPNEHGRIKVE
jgi:plastocyanin